MEGLIQEYLDRLQLNSEKTADCLDNVKSTNQIKEIDMDENANFCVDESVMEKVLQKRSLRMRNMQRAWQVWFFVVWSMLLDICILNYMLELASHDQKMNVAFIPAIGTFIFFSGISYLSYMLKWKYIYLIVIDSLSVLASSSFLGLANGNG